ncbi:MAG: PIN domain-containing protein [Bacteroidetes bacterium]|nr:PIN domain-containing protein [Bacteroidota bacterium]
MKGRYFLDTNIIVYSFDHNNPDKQKTAQELIFQALKTGNGLISYQIIQEFINVSTRKFAQPLSLPDVVKYYEQVLEPLFEIIPSSELYMKALEITDRWKYSFYDSLVISAALEGNCSILYSEDLQDGQKIEQLKIVNPFKE